MSGPEIRAKRREAAIPGSLLCSQARIQRSRLSDIERGYVAPRLDEVSRIASALERLSAAKHRLDALAAEVGWPLPEVSAPTCSDEGK
jgi:predicted transcriptional regulator